MTCETCNTVDCAGCTVGPSSTAQGVQSDHAATKVLSETGVPAGIKGWCWGGFLLNWIWAIGNRTWIGLLCGLPYVGLGVSVWLGDSDDKPAWTGLLSVTPFVGLGVAIWLGIKGRELAWKNREWESVEHFNRVQRAWTIWGIVINLLPVVVLIACVWFVGAFVHWFLESPHSFRIG